MNNRAMTEHTAMKSRLGILATGTMIATVTLSVLFDTTVYLWLICAAVVAVIAGVNWIHVNRTSHTRD